MVDNDEKKSGPHPHSSRRNQLQPPHRYHRNPPGVDKALHIFGVTDLRELLNKKHQQDPDNIDKSKVPPSDPSYNLLKDPSRDVDTTKEASNIQRGKVSPHKPKQQQINDNKKSHRGNSHRGRGSRAERPDKNEAPDTIKSPANIKIEFKPATGERSCIIDESVTLSDIKHVPDKVGQSPKRYWRGRGRGRGPHRGRGRINLNERLDKAKKDSTNTDCNNTDQFDETTIEQDNSNTEVEPNGDENNTLPALDGMNYESELVKRIEENFVITATDKNEAVTRSIEMNDSKGNVTQDNQNQ